MTFLVILCTLIAERLLVRWRRLRDGDWFERWFELHQTLPLGPTVREGPLGLAGLLLAPLLALAGLLWLVDSLLPAFAGWLLSGLVLLYALGPGDLPSEVDELVEASENGDPERAHALAEHIVPTLGGSGGLPSRGLTHGILQAAHQRIFVTLFWFLVLGALGALACRLSRDSQRIGREQARSGMDEALQRWFFVLQWLPARLLAILFALGGCFEPAIQAFKHCDSRAQDDPAAAIVGCAGAGALQLDTTVERESAEGPDSFLLRATMALVWRSLVILVALIGWASISAWIF